MLSELINKRILLTGSRGYIGSALQNKLKDIPCHLIRVARPDKPFIPLHGCATVEDHAISMLDDSFWKEILPRVDIIFHLAAQTSVAKANQDPLTDWQENIKPLLVLMEQCKTLENPPILVFSSSAAIYGNPSHFPVDESFPNHPLSIYECHKLMAEQYIHYYTQHNVIRGVNLRLANVYGPGVAASNQDRSILNQMIKKALNLEPLTIYGEGKFLRDYIYIHDVATAFLLAATHITNTSGNTYLISSGVECYFSTAIYAVAEKVSQRLGKEVLVKHIEPPATLTAVDLRHFVGNSGRFKETTGWDPQWNFSQGLDQTILEFLNL